MLKLHRFTRSPLRLYLLVLVAFFLASIVYAQTLPNGIALTLDNFRLAASNPLIFAGLVVSVVADVRSITHVDGKIMVTALAVVLGAIIGIIFQLIGILAIDPFSTWAIPWGGLTYGAAMGIFARYGINLIDLLFHRNATKAAVARKSIDSGNVPTPAP